MRWLRWTRGVTESLSHPDRRAAALVALTGGVLALPFLASISMLDEGALVHIADRIASREVLYRDVATGVMPGSFYLHALLFLVFGRSLLVGRVFMILLFALASAGVFLTARSVSTRTVALAAAVSFLAFSVRYWRVPGYSAEAIFLILLTLAAARAFLNSRRQRWLFLTGLGLGFTILFKQNYGTFASLGVAIGLAAAAPHVRRGFRDVATAAVVAAIPIAVTAALFASAGAGKDFWRFTVGVPLQIPHTVFTRSWPPLWGEPDRRLLRDIVYYLPFEELATDSREWLLGHERLTLAIVRVTYYLPPLFLLAAGVAWFRRRARRRRPSDATPGSAQNLAAGALYLGTSAFLFLGVFPRVDTHHLFMALAPCFGLAAWLLGPEPRPFVRRSAVVVAGISLTLSVLSQVASITSVHPEEVRDAFLDHPRARVWVERWQAAQILRQLEQIEERVPEGEPIFVAPSSPMYYFLANRPNPSRYPLILPGALDEEEVVRTLDLVPVRHALISDIAFESFPFQYVAPVVWNYLYRHFKPAEGAGWDDAPFAPYLYIRGHRAEARVDLIPASSESAGKAARPMLTVGTDYSDWIEARTLVQDPLSPTPLFQTLALDEWRNRDPYLVDWQSTYLAPSLVVRAPGGWRKVLVSWEVPADPGYSFEFACALTPWAWAGWEEGQGALVEVWLSSSPETGPPRRVFFRWLNPRHVLQDRRWHRAAVDLSSFVQTRKAIVTLVVVSAPTFLAADATVAWSDLRLMIRNDLSPEVSDLLPAEPRNVRLDQGAARHILYFQEEDLPTFQEAARKYPHLGSAHIALAEVAASLDHHELALAATQTAVRVEPEHAYFWIRLGQELQHAGRVAEAIEAIETALDKDPTNANYHAALASAHLTEPSGWEKARASTLDALRLDPGNAWAWTLLASVERQLGNPEAAVRAAERSVTLEPNKAWPRLAQAASLHAAGRTVEALLVLEQAAALEMDSGARAELARNFLLCGHAQRAREEALAGIEQEPRSVGSWTVLGHAEVALREWEPAVRAWREVVALDPGNSSALVQLARSLAMSGRGTEALEAVIMARALARDDPARIREVAIVLDELGASDEALSAWQRVLALAPAGELKAEARRRLGATRSRG